MSMSDQEVGPAKEVVVIRTCKKCERTTIHHINKEAWGVRVYGEAMRILAEDWLCEEHKPQPQYQYPEGWDYE